MKKFLLSVSMVALLGSSVLPVSAFASERTIQENINEENNEVKAYVDLLKPFVKVAEDGTLFLDESYKDSVQVPEGVVESIKSWQAELNQDILNGDFYVTEGLEVISKLPQGFVGSNEVEIVYYWWGFGLYIGNNVTKDLEKLLASGASISKGVNLITKKSSDKRAKTIEYIADIVSWVFATGYMILRTNNDGNGVLITITHPAIFDIEPL
ncbi:hypothetical protein [uncultured Brevibacillus sp.]|uniref:hypothetical protein n=1 Tax=uncultured Brevibacillus sp. TaxID=169970 RepID=UPI002593024D|nr:hypothetical protein [uncultured Brevibacillus sp.]